MLTRMLADVHLARTLQAFGEHLIRRCRHLLNPYAMSSADRAQWAQTQSLRDVASLTAVWLRGGIHSQPGYIGPVDTDPAAGLLEALICLNEAGILTVDSQEGAEEAGSDGETWVQHAYVSAIAGPGGMRALRGFADRYGLRCLAARTGRSWVYNPGWDVTYRGGEPHTSVGTIRPAHHLRDPWAGYGVCGARAVDEIAAAWQVTVVDPTPGRNTMWPRLRDMAAALSNPSEIFTTDGSEP